MAEDATLFGVLGDFRALWPSSVFMPSSGIDLTDVEITAWLATLNDAIRLRDIKTNSDSNKVVLQARFYVDLVIAAQPEGFPLAIRTMPDVEFRILHLEESKAGWLYVTQSDGNLEILIEGLPVEIRLPPGLLGLHPDDEAEVSADDSGESPGDEGGVSPYEKTIGSFSAGEHDRQEVVQRRDGQSSIRTHLRVQVTNDQEVTLSTPVPISFGKCRFLELPAIAVHDFRLLPFPEVAREHEEWLRHGVGPWVGDPESVFGGCFAVRGLELDPKYGPVSDIQEWASGHAKKSDLAHLVLEDLVVPFVSPWVLPIPRHITTGIRRNIEDPLEPKALFDFDQAPMQWSFGEDPKWGITIEKFYYVSQPPEALTDTFDLGVTFSAAVFFGEIEEPNNAITIGLGENLTPRIGYRREVDVNTGVLLEDGTEFNLLKFELLGINIEIMGLTIGYSIGRSVGEGAGFGDSAEIYGDLFVSSDPTGDDDATFRLRSLNNQPLRFVMEGVGWRQGSLHLDGVRLPDGVAIMFGSYGLVIEELGIGAEDGATYLSVSGGLLYDPPGQMIGAVLAKRLRFRISGNENAPFFKLDGLFGFLRIPDLLHIEFGGYYTDDRVDGVRRKEFGFTGTIILELSIADYGLAIDLLAGEITSPSESFDYQMFQANFTGLIPIYSVEIRGLRFLFVNDMQPKLSELDESIAELRYFSWYKKNDPVRVPGNRRLAAWKPVDDSQAWGAGATLSFTGLGNAARFTVFVLYADSPEEDGLLITLECYLMSAKKPSGYAVLEFDLQNERWAAMLGVDIKLSDFIDDLPDWLNAITLKGDLLFGNKPGTIALGRLKDQRSWLSLIFDMDIWVFRSFLQVGLCFEWVDEGDWGFGVVVRIEGGVNARPMARISYHAGVGVVYTSFKTGSVDQSLAALIEAGVRAVLFGFLRVGLTVGAELTWVARQPSRTEFVARLRFETPWFLPDVKFTLECTTGTVEPSALSIFTSPLQSGSATQALTSTDSPKQGSNRPLHLERWDNPTFDPDTGEELPRDAHSIAEFRARTLGEAQRVNRFITNDTIEPVSVDSTIGIEFTSLVDDALSLGPVPANQGKQNSGDLEARYELVGLRIRRRPRFGASTDWTLAEERLALDVDFDAPGGPTLSGTFEPHEITKFWAEDVRTEAGTATKKLLLNSSTPYDFVTSNPEADEDTVSQNPAWPCCPRKDQFGQWRRHRLRFTGETPGGDISGHRVFTESESRWHSLVESVALPHLLGSLPAGLLVAGAHIRGPGVLYRADLVAPGMHCAVRLAWSTRVPAKLDLVAFDRGDEVGRESLDLAPGATDFQTVTLLADRPFTAFEVQLRTEKKVADYLAGTSNAGAVATDPSGGLYLEVDEFSYVAWAEYLDEVREAIACNSASDDFQAAWQAKGKLFFLPNHQYEIETTVAVHAGHPSVESESTEVKEYIYFQTKGLPGLNAQSRVGEEVEPYVRSAYTGGRGRVYREEPVAVAFQEDFYVAVPLSIRPPGTIEERHRLFRMALTVRPETASDSATQHTVTATDWIVDNRSGVTPPSWGIWFPVLANSEATTTTAMSANPLRLRLAQITQRPTAQCPLPDPTEVISPLLIARPQGVADPENAGEALWLAGKAYRGVVRQEGAAFVDRDPFESADLTAMTFVSTGPGLTGAWSVQDGELRHAASQSLGHAIFGEEDWNHLRVQVSVFPGGGNAGVCVAVGHSGSTLNQSLYAMVQTRSDDTRELALLRRQAGAQTVEIATLPLPGEDDWVDLIIEAFDDAIRVSSGDVELQAARNELREGRLALVGTSGTRFRELRVEGLDLYAINFQTSRYRSFSEHIQSFDDNVRALMPTDMGSGLAVASVEDLWAEAGADIRAAMVPNGDLTERQRLFLHWATALAIPLVQEPTELRISRVSQGPGIDAFLVESPEPIDYSEEVTVELGQWVRTRSGHLAEVIDVLGRILEKLRRRPPFDVWRILEDPRLDLSPRTNLPKDRPNVRALLDKAPLAETLRAAASDLSPRRPELRGKEPDFPRPSMRVTRVGKRLHARLNQKQFGAAVRAGDEIELAEFARPANARGALEIVRWRGKAEVVRPGSFLVRTERIGRGIGVEALDGLSNLERELIEGVIIAIDPRRNQVIDWYLPKRWVWEDVAVQLLQDEAARRALIIPLSDSQAARRLSASQFRLRFRMLRMRWHTTEAPDEDNHYQDEATLELNL